MSKKNPRRRQHPRIDAPFKGNVIRPPSDIHNMPVEEKEDEGEDRDGGPHHHIRRQPGQGSGSD